MRLIKTAYASVTCRGLALLSLALLSIALPVNAQQLIADGFEPINMPDYPKGPCRFTITTNNAAEKVLKRDARWINTPSECDYFIKRPDSPRNAAVFMIDAKLTIDPGTVIMLDKGVFIRVIDNGQIIAKGQPNNRIQFMGAQPEKGYADGIYFGSDSLVSEFDYVDFRYLGSDNPIIAQPDGALDSLRGAGIKLTNSTISHSSYVGADFVQLPLLAFANNKFYANGSYPFKIGADQVGKLDSISDYSGASMGQNQQNAEPFINVKGVYYPLKNRATLYPLNAPYYVEVAFWVEDGGDLTVEPGVTFLMKGGASFTIKDGGVIKAKGTSANPIVFRSKNRNEKWDSFGISYTNTRNELDFVVIDGAGDNSDKSSIRVVKGQLTLTNSAIGNGTQYGVCTYNSTLRQSNNTFIGLRGVTEC